MKTIKVSLNLGALGRSKWYEYGLRFAFGGIITLVAGLIAGRFGPAAGGLFLAFPAIFPASATLVEKHEKEKKRRAGFEGSIRGRQAAGLDAAGAAIGSIGLIAFAGVVWLLLDRYKSGLVLVSATTVWVSVSGMLWYIRKTKPWNRPANN